MMMKITLLLLLAVVVLTEASITNSNNRGGYGRGRTRSGRGPYSRRDISDEYDPLEERNLVNVAQALKTMSEEMLRSKRSADLRRGIDDEF